MSKLFPSYHHGSQLFVVRNVLKYLTTYSKRRYFLFSPANQVQIDGSITHCLGLTLIVIGQTFKINILVNKKTAEIRDH